MIEEGDCVEITTDILHPYDDYMIKTTGMEGIVDNNGELGVKVNGRCFFLYKGENIVYENKDGSMKYRPVGKREFGEVCYPLDEYYPKMTSEYHKGKGQYRVDINGNKHDEWMKLP